MRVHYRIEGKFIAVVAICKLTKEMERSRLNVRGSVMLVFKGNDQRRKFWEAEQRVSCYQVLNRVPLASRAGALTTAPRSLAAILSCASSSSSGSTTTSGVQK